MKKNEKLNNNNTNLYRTSFLVDKNNYTKLKFYAVATGKKLVDCFNEALEDYLKKHAKTLEEFGITMDTKINKKK